MSFPPITFSSSFTSFKSTFTQIKKAPQDISYTYKLLKSMMVMEKGVGIKTILLLIVLQNALAEVLRDKRVTPSELGCTCGSQKSYPWTAGISEQSGKSIQNSRGAQSRTGKSQSPPASSSHALPPRGIRKDLFCPPRGLKTAEARGGGTGEATSCPLPTLTGPGDCSSYKI